MSRARSDRAARAAARAPVRVAYHTQPRSPPLLTIVILAHNKSALTRAMPRRARERPGRYGGDPRRQRVDRRHAGGRAGLYALSPVSLSQHTARNLAYAAPTIGLARGRRRHAAVPEQRRRRSARRARAPRRCRRRVRRRRRRPEAARFLGRRRSSTRECGRVWGYVSNLGTARRATSRRSTARGAIFAVTGAMLGDRPAAVRADGRIRRAISLGIRRRGPLPARRTRRARPSGMSRGREHPRGVRDAGGGAALRGSCIELRALSAEWNHVLVPNERAAVGALTPRARARVRGLRHGHGRRSGLYRIADARGIDVVGFTASAVNVREFLRTSRAAARGDPGLAIRSPDRGDPALLSRCAIASRCLRSGGRPTFPVGAARLAPGDPKSSG